MPVMIRTSEKRGYAAQRRPPLLMAHYLPWYEANPTNKQWGWHWTMNHFAPDRQDAKGRREAASHFRPLIGLYDSGDPDTLRCQALLMKLSGIDGVIIDWYGNENLYDYAQINRNTERLVPILHEAGLKFILCYEDQTVPKLIEAKRFTADEAVAHAQRLMRWIQEHYFRSPVYYQQEGRPVLLSFGVSYYNDDQWNQIFSVLPKKPLYFSEHERRAPTAAAGAFDWPQPNGGSPQALKAWERFYTNTPKGQPFIPAAFPRFQDIYAQANVHPSWGSIDDQNGRTYTNTLSRALKSDAALIQLVTWNDWGEGTQIEPSVEFGYRDLEATQRLRKPYLTKGFPYTAQDLRLPVEWYLLRKKYATDKAISARLADFFPLVVNGRMAQARALLAKYR